MVTSLFKPCGSVGIYCPRKSFIRRPRVVFTSISNKFLPGVQGTGDCIAVRRADPYTAVRPVHSDDCTFLCRQGQHGGPCGLCFVQRKAECIPCPACKRDAARQTVQREQFFQRERGTIFGAASVGIGQRNSACCQMNAVRRNTGRQSRHRLHLQCSRVIRHQNAADS